MSVLGAKRKRKAILFVIVKLPILAYYPMKTKSVEKTKELIKEIVFRYFLPKVVAKDKKDKVFEEAMTLMLQDQMKDGELLKLINELSFLINEETKKGILAYRQTHHNKYIKEHKERNRQRGLCWDCTSKRVDESKWYCKRCLEIHRKNSRDSYYRRKALVTNHSQEK